MHTQAIGGVSFLYVCHDLSFSVFEDYKGTLCLNTRSP